MGMRVISIRRTITLGIALAFTWTPLSSSAFQQATAHPDVQALLRQGKQARDKYQWEEAIRLNTEALGKAEALQDQYGQAVALNELAMIYYSAGDPPKAVEFCRRAMSAYRSIGNKRGEAAAAMVMGVLLYSSGEMQKALESFEHALPLYQALGDKLDAAHLLGNIASIYTNTGQPAKALDFYQQELAIDEAIGDKNISLTLVNMGLVYMNISQPQKALELYERALTMDRASGDKGREAISLVEIGHVRLFYGDFQKALDLYEQALPILRATRNRLREASVLSAIGEIHHASGQPKKALEFYQQALEISNAISEKRLEAQTLINIGRVYFHLGQSEKALEFYLTSLPVLRQVDDKVFQATALTNIGDVYMARGDSQNALVCYRESLLLSRSAGNKEWEACALGAIGSVYAHTGALHNALEMHEQARRIFESTGDSHDLADTLVNIGSVYNSIGQSRKALQFFQQALPIFVSLGDKRGEALLYADRALTYENLGDLERAEESWKAAVRCFESYRIAIGGLSEAKQSHLRSTLDVYHNYIRLLLKRNKTKLAFEVVQKTKARNLLDLMYDGRVDISSSLTTAERRREQELRQMTFRLNKEIVSEGVKRSVTPTRLQELKKQLSAAENALQTYTDSLYNRHPGLAHKRAAKTLTLADAAGIMSSDTVLLEYVALTTDVGKDRSDRTELFALTVTNGKPLVHAFTIPMSRTALAEKVSDLRSSCADPQGRFQSKSRALYDLVIAPAKKLLEGKNRLLICPDGPLWDLPFQALLDPHGKFLLENHEIAYAYGATGVQAATDAGARRRKTPAGVVLMAMANPDFGDETRFGGIPGSSPAAGGKRPIEALSRDVIIPRGGKILRLPGTQREADALKLDFPQAAIYTGRDAQESTVKREAGKYRYIHFATHGFFNDASPLMSSIVLADPGPPAPNPGGVSSPAPEDGFLTAREIFDLKLNAEMVVLSACNTARGEKRSGEGVIGLTWALFAAGCPTQVVSQWSVDDASTAALMERFYSGIAKGKPKGASLRLAALSLLNQARKSKIENRKYAHPYYWAPFILMGDWR